MLNSGSASPGDAGRNGSGRELLLPALFAVAFGIVFWLVLSRCRRVHILGLGGQWRQAPACSRAGTASCSDGDVSIPTARRGRAVSPPFAMLAPECSGAAESTEMMRTGRTLCRTRKNMVRHTAHEMLVAPHIPPQKTFTGGRNSHRETTPSVPNSTPAPSTLSAQVEAMKCGSDAASVSSCSTEGDTSQHREARAEESAALANDAQVGASIAGSDHGGNSVSGNNGMDAPTVVIDSNGQPSAMFVYPPRNHRMGRPAQGRGNRTQRSGTALLGRVPSKKQASAAAGGDAASFSAAVPASGDCAGADFFVGSQRRASSLLGESQEHIDSARG